MTLADRISEWIAQKVEEAHQEGVVFGLSGGIDSAVVGALCLRALGDRALGLIMPCHSLPIDEEYALLAATRFGIRHQRVDLTPVFDAFAGVLPPADGVARANLKPRLRMATLYYYANCYRYLVVGSGNKSELSVGYFTKYGDGGVDIQPLGCLLKGQVRELAGELGVPKEILERPPTAGLWAGQTDEEELGMTYAMLDRAIESLETGRYEDVPSSALERVKRMYRSSAHKRCLPPIFQP